MGLFGKKKSYADGQYLKKYKNRDDTVREKILLESDEDDIIRMDGVVFADLVKLVLKRQGWQFEPLDMSGDYGADFIISLNNKRTVVRCVKYTRNTVIDNEIDKIETARFHYKADQAMLITSGLFTMNENQYARGRVTLIDGNKLMNWIIEVR